LFPQAAYPFPFPNSIVSGAKDPCGCAEGRKFDGQGAIPSLIALLVAVFGKGKLFLRQKLAQV
jgi:hypothetical protein